MSDPTDRVRSYDPDYGHWDFGKISALREIALADEGAYEYYYMGMLAQSLKATRFDVC